MANIGEEVGAAFFVEDRATSVLEKIGEAFEQVDGIMGAATKSAREFAAVRFGEVSKSIRNLTDAMSGLRDSAEALPAAFESAMSRIVEETARAKVALAEMRAEMVETEAVSSRMGGGIFGGGGRGGGGGGGGGGHGGSIHGRAYVPMGSFGHVGLGGALMSLPVLGGAAAVENALSQGGKRSMDVFNSVVAAGEDPTIIDTTERGAREREQVNNIIDEAVKNTRYKATDMSSALPGLMGLVASAFTKPDGSLMTTQERLDAVAPVARSSYLFAEEQKQKGLGDIKENMMASGMFLHLLGHTDPADVAHDTTLLSALTTEQYKSAQLIEGVQKYSIPIGMAAGFNTDEVAMATAFLGREGIGGSTAGTGLGRVFLEDLKTNQRSSQPGTPENQARRSLEEALKGESHYSSGHRQTSAQEKENERREMGLVDAQGRKTYLDEKGNPVFDKMIGAIHDWSERMKSQGKGGQVGSIVEDVFQVQGTRAIMKFLGSGEWERWQNMKVDVAQRMKTQSPWDVQAGQSQEPIQRFGQLWSRFEDAMGKLAGDGTHGLLYDLGNAALHGISGLEALGHFFDTHEQATKIMAEGGVGALIGGILGMIIPVPGATVAGMLIGALIGTGVGSRDSKSIMEMPSLPTDNQFLNPDGSPTFDLRKLFKNSPGRMDGPPEDAGSRWGIQPQSYHPNSAPQVNIEKIVFEGMPADPEEHAQQLSSHLVRILSRAQLHDLGSGGGFTSSPFSVGRGTQT